MNTNSIVYAEVDTILNTIDKEYKNKLPKKLLSLISKYKKDSYIVNYDINKPLHEQNISKEAISMIALIHLNYWCKDENEKKELFKILQENEIKNEAKKRAKYSPDSVFKNKIISGDTTVQQEVSQNVELTVYKENIFEKFIKFFKNLFNKKHQ